MLGTSLIIISIWLFGALGWIINIVQLVNSGPIGQWAALEIMRAIGIFFAPLGSVLGLFVW